MATQFSKPNDWHVKRLVQIPLRQTIFKQSHASDKSMRLKREKKVRIAKMICCKILNAVVVNWPIRNLIMGTGL